MLDRFSVTTLEEASREGLAHVELSDNGGSYVRDRPYLINDHLVPANIRKGYEKTIGNAPPSGIATFRNVTVLPNGTIVLENGEAISESLERNSLKWLPKQAFNVKEGPDAAVLATKVGAKNYGHFIVEILPRIMQCKELIGPKTPVLLSELSRGFADQIIRYATGSELDRIFIGESALSIKRLVWPLRNTIHPMDNSPRAIQRVASLRLPCVPTSGRKLFLTRRDAVSRKLVDESAIFSALEPMGFEWISPGNLEFSKQVEVFSGAEMVVAVAGAALTNLVFMPEESKVAMLAPSTMAGYFFWDLCFHRSIKFGAAFGSNISDQAVDKNADFFVGTNSVHELISMLD